MKTEMPQRTPHDQKLNQILCAYECAHAQAGAHVPARTRAPTPTGPFRPVRLRMCPRASWRPCPSEDQSAHAHGTLQSCAASNDLSFVFCCYHFTIGFEIFCAIFRPSMALLQKDEIIFFIFLLLQILIVIICIECMTNIYSKCIYFCIYIYFIYVVRIAIE